MNTCLPYVFTHIKTKRIVLYGGVGFCGKMRPLRKGKKTRRKQGIRKRKTVCGHKITDSISQINISVLKEGAKKLADALGGAKEAGKEGAKPEAKPAEKPAETKEEQSSSKPQKSSISEKPKEAPKKEEPKAEEKPKEAPKEEAKK